MAAPIPLADALKTRDSRALALFLDIDGTLLEFSETPDSVHVPAPLVKTLDTAYRTLGGALALISGRALGDIDRLFAPLKLPAAGLHGFDIRGVTVADTDHARHIAAIEAERTRLHQSFADDARILIEDKGPCIAVHYRRAPDKEARVAEAVAAAQERLGPAFETLSGHMLYELRPAGIGKGHAVDALMRAAPFRGRTPVFIGDDVTDEDGFVAVNALGGISVCVGPRRPTAAIAQLENVDAVRGWLNDLGEMANASLSGGNVRETMHL